MRDSVVCSHAARLGSALAMDTIGLYAVHYCPTAAEAIVKEIQNARYVDGQDHP